jgi:hypothetical protein
VRKDSIPWWPPRTVPPKGAPNVLLILTDDAGYGIASTFGGVIPTRALDRIAKMGLRCGGNFYRATFQGNNLVYVTAKP